jgi:hypothetical protein
MLVARYLLKCSVSQGIERLIQISEACFTRRREREPNRAPILGTRHFFDQPLLYEILDSAAGPTFIKADAAAQGR